MRVGLSLKMVRFKRKFRDFRSFYVFGMMSTCIDLRFCIGRLAAILVVDQMSRMIFRRSAKAYENDKLGFKLAQEMVASGELEKAGFLDKLFIILPYKHQEDLKVVEKSVGNCYFLYIL